MSRTKSNSPSEFQPEGFDQAYARAVRLLSLRDRFAGEVRTELAKRSTGDVVEAVVERLLQRRILDDRRVMRALIEANRGKKSLSVGALKHKCAARGADPEALELLESTEQPAIGSLLDRYDLSPKGRSRAYRFLMSRGFEEGEVEAALEAHFGSSVTIE